MTKHEKNVTSEMRQRKLMLRQGFLCWMSKPGGTCRDIKAPVATLETGRKQRFYRNGILCCDKKLKSNTGRILRHIGLCCDTRKNRRQNLCRDIKSPVATLIIATWNPIETLYEEVMS